MTQISLQFEQLLTSTFCKLFHFISKGHKFEMTKRRKRKGNILAHIPTKLLYLNIVCKHTMSCLYCSDLDDKIKWTKKPKNIGG